MISFWKIRRELRNRASFKMKGAFLLTNRRVYSCIKGNHGKGGRKVKLLSELEAKLVSKQKAKLQEFESNESISIEREVKGEKYSRGRKPYFRTETSFEAEPEQGNRDIGLVAATAKRKGRFASEIVVNKGETLETGVDKWFFPDEIPGSLQKPSSTELFLSAIASDLLQTLEIIEYELDKSTGIFDIEVKGMLSTIGLVDSKQPRLGRLLITGRIESVEQEESAIKLLEEAGKRSVLLNSLKVELEITIKTL
jgi:hypothetical protein